MLEIILGWSLEKTENRDGKSIYRTVTDTPGVRGS